MIFVFFLSRACPSIVDDQFRSQKPAREQAKHWSDTCLQQPKGPLANKYRHRGQVHLGKAQKENLSVPARPSPDRAPLVLDGVGVHVVKVVPGAARVVGGNVGDEEALADLALDEARGALEALVGVLFVNGLVVLGGQLAALVHELHERVQLGVGVLGVGDGGGRLFGNKTRWSATRLTGIVARVA